jgi:hypothetical protein
VLGDHPVKGLDVLQGAPHQQRIRDALAVVGEHPDPGSRIGHRTELGQLVALQSHGNRADRLDVGMAGFPAQPPDLLDHARRVGDRLGVRHRVHRGEAAERRGGGAGLDRLRVFTARLTQVRVQVDEAWQRDQPGGVDDLRVPGVQARADLRYDAVGDLDVHLVAGSLVAGSLVAGHGHAADQPFVASH